MSVTRRSNFFMPFEYSASNLRQKNKKKNWNEFEGIHKGKEKVKIT